MAVEGPLGFRLKANYGAAQMGESLVNGVLGSFLLFFYSQVLGMSPALASLGVGVAVIVDAFTDPLVGSLSDRSRSRHGRRHPFMYFGAIPTGICMYLLFNPLVTTELGLLLWMILFVNLTRTAMTVFHIPHIAMGAELTEDYDERSSVVGYRTFFANVGGLSAFVLGFGIFFAPTPEFENGQLNPLAYPPFAALVAILLMASVFWTAWSTRHTIPFLPTSSMGARESIWRVIPDMFGDVRLALASGSFRWLFLGVLVLFIIIGIDAALSVHMFTFFWELDQFEIVILSPAFAVGAIGGILISPALLRRFGKKAMLQFGLMVWRGSRLCPWCCDSLTCCRRTVTRY